MYVMYCDYEYVVGLCLWCNNDQATGGEVHYSFVEFDVSVFYAFMCINIV